MIDILWKNNNLIDSHPFPYLSLSGDFYSVGVIFLDQEELFFKKTYLFFKNDSDLQN